MRRWIKCILLPATTSFYPRSFLFLPLRLFIFSSPAAAAPTTRENCVPPVPSIKKSFPLASFRDTEIMERKTCWRAQSRHFSLNLLISNKLLQSHDRSICLSVCAVETEERHILGSFFVFICSDEFINLVLT